MYSMIFTVGMMTAPDVPDLHLRGGCNGRESRAEARQGGGCNGRQGKAQAGGCNGRIGYSFAPQGCQGGVGLPRGAMIAPVPGGGVVVAPAAGGPVYPAPTDPTKYDPGPPVGVGPVGYPLPMEGPGHTFTAPRTGPVRESFGFFAERGRTVFRSVVRGGCPAGGCR